MTGDCLQEIDLPDEGSSLTTLYSSVDLGVYSALRTYELQIEPEVFWRRGGPPDRETLRLREER